MKQALLPLTSFRFFAAVAVVMCHRPHSGADSWLPYERHGHAGVTFFFLLSGFILTYTYHDRFVSRQPRVTRDFLIARWARLVPAYFLAFLLVLVVWPRENGGHVLWYPSARWLALSHLTLTQSWVPDARYYYAFNPPAWSLSCEWFFYLVFPVLLLGLATGSLLRRVAVFAAFSAVWATAFAAYQFSSIDLAREYLKWMWAGYVFPPTRVFDFACGVALGVVFVRLRPAVGPARGGRYWAWGLVELGALAVLWATFHFCPWSPGANGEIELAIQMLTWQGYYLPAFACLVWVGALGRGSLSRVMSWSPLVYLGELSYGVYIFHFPFVLLFVPPVPLGHGGAPSATTLVLFYVSTLAAAALSYHFWETPIRRLLRGRPKAPAALPLPAPAALPERRAA